MLKSLERQEAYFPQIGVLHKGAKKTSSNRPGVDLTYFRLDACESVMNVFTEEFGEQPQEIPIYLRTPKALDSFEAWMEDYDSTGIKTRCDGESIHAERRKLRNKDKWKWYEYPEDARPDCRQECGECKCKNNGRLRFVIPNIAVRGWVGEVLFGFTSTYDIHEIYSNLHAFNGNATQGRFLLRRVEKEVVTTDDKGQRRRQAKWLCSVVPEPEWVAHIIASQRYDAPAIAAAPASSQLPPAVEQLPAPECELVPAEVVEDEELEPPAYRTAAATPEISEAEARAIAAREATEDVNSEDLIAATDVEMQRAGVKPTAGRRYLKDEFGKSKRAELTEDELRIFLADLKVMPAARKEPANV